MCQLCGGSQVPNGDYCTLFHLNRPQERKRLQQFYLIFLISKTHVQVAQEEVQNINKVLAQPACVHKMLKKQNKKTTPKKPANNTTTPVFSPAPLINIFGTILQARINTYFLRHLFRDLRLPVEPCLGSCSPLPFL